MSLSALSSLSFAVVVSFVPLESMTYLNRTSTRIRRMLVKAIRLQARQPKFMWENRYFVMGPLARSLLYELRDSPLATPVSCFSHTEFGKFMQRYRPSNGTGYAQCHDLDFQNVMFQLNLPWLDLQNFIFTDYRSRLYVRLFRRDDPAYWAHLWLFGQDRCSIIGLRDYGFDRRIDVEKFMLTLSPECAQFLRSIGFGVAKRRRDFTPTFESNKKLKL